MNVSSALTQQEKTLTDWLDIPPVFVVGCAGSGTTLLRLMLGAHPSISISSQGASLYHLRSTLSRCGDLADPKRLEALYHDILPFLEGEKVLSPPTFEQLLYWVNQFGADSRSIITFYGTWEARVLGKEHLAWWGQTAPYHVYHVPYLNFLFPNCKFIVVLRDPRDVFATSKVDSGWDFLKLREEWESSLLHGLLSKLCLGASRVQEVQYETLVTNPQGVLRGICAFLQVAYTDEMLSYNKSDAVQDRHVLAEEEADAVRSRLYGPMRLLGYISYEEYEQISRNGLSKVHRRRSTTLGVARPDQTNGSRTTVHHESPWQHWIDVPPVFIVGHGRSGTTLLRMMLTAHPNLFISSEGAYVCPLRCTLSSYGDFHDVHNLERLRSALLPWLEAVNYLSPPGIDDLAAWVERFGCDERALITFYGTWEARILAKRDLVWWGDNEPTHVFNIPYFKRLFPNSKFILMIRDPRDVFASFKAAWPKFHTAESLALCWERCLLDGLLAVSCLGDSTVKQVRYEHLVTDPRAQLEEICGFLHVEYTDAMLQFHTMEAATHLSRVAHHRNVVKPVFTDSVGKYRQILTREEIAAIERRLCTPMRYFGYLSYEEYDQISSQ